MLNKELNDLRRRAGLHEQHDWIDPNRQYMMIVDQTTSVTGDRNEIGQAVVRALENGAEDITIEPVENDDYQGEV